MQPFSFSPPTTQPHASSSSADGADTPLSSSSSALPFRFAPPAADSDAPAATAPFQAPSQSSLPSSSRADMHPDSNFPAQVFETPQGPSLGLQPPQTRARPVPPPPAPLFALMTPGMPLQTAWRPMGPRKMVLELSLPARVAQVGVAMVSPAVPADHVSAVFFALPPYDRWEYMGYIDLEYPSRMFLTPWFGRIDDECPSVLIGLSMETLEWAEAQPAPTAPMLVAESGRQFATALAIAQDFDEYLSQKLAQVTRALGKKTRGGADGGGAGGTDGDEQQRERELEGADEVTEEMEENNAAVAMLAAALPRGAIADWLLDFERRNTLEPLYTQPGDEVVVIDDATQGPAPSSNGTAAPASPQKKSTKKKKTRKKGKGKARRSSRS